MTRLRALLKSFGDWLYNWKIALFGEHGEHDTERHEDQ